MNYKKSNGLNYILISDTALFQGCSPVETEKLLSGMQFFTKAYKKGVPVYHAGTPVSDIGIVLHGVVQIENNDLWGNKNIISLAQAGEVFAEAYACIPGEPLLVTVSAAMDSTVLLINAGRILTTCPNSCAFHGVLIQNLLTLCARKNLQLSRRMQHTAPKTIRGRLTSYFSQCLKQSGSRSFDLPYDRQQLADYLNVERSALSGELSKMQQDGLIRYHRNHFEVLD